MVVSCSTHWMVWLQQRRPLPVPSPSPRNAPRQTQQVQIHKGTIIRGGMVEDIMIGRPSQKRGAAIDMENGRLTANGAIGKHHGVVTTSDDPNNPAHVLHLPGLLHGSGRGQWRVGRYKERQWVVVVVVVLWRHGRCCRVATAI